MIHRVLPVLLLPLLAAAQIKQIDNLPDLKLYDEDMQCSLGERLSIIVRASHIRRDGRPLSRGYRFLCDPLEEELKDVKVTRSDRALECGLQKQEGCTGNNEYLCGLTAYGTGRPAYILVPSCCTASNLKIENNNIYDCKNTTLNRAFNTEVKFLVDEGDVITNIGCVNIVEKLRSGSHRIIEQQIRVQTCLANFVDSDEKK